MKIYHVVILLMIVIFFFPVLLETLSAVNENIVFFAGRPFHFYLVHNRTPRLVLFEGRFERPEDHGSDKLVGTDEVNLEPLIHNESGEEENVQPNLPKPTQRPTNGFPDQTQRPLSASPATNYNHHKNPNYNQNQPDKTNENNQVQNVGPNPIRNRYPQQQQPFPQNVNGNNQEYFNKQQNPDINNAQVFSSEKGPASNDKNPGVVLPFSEQEPAQHPQRRPQGPSKNSGSYQFDRSGIWAVSVDQERAWRLQQQLEEQNQRRYQISRYQF